MSRLPRTLYERVNVYLDAVWERMSIFDKISYVYFMSMMLIYGLVLIRFIIVNGLI